MIKLRYITGCPNYKTFSTSTLTSFFSNNPTVCLLTPTGLHVYQLPEAYATHLLVQLLQQEMTPTTSVSNKRLIKEENPEDTLRSKKILKTSAHQLSLQRKSYHRNKTPLLKRLRDKRNKTKGIIHLLNKNPTLDIQQLIYEQTTPTPILLSVPSTTSKSWTQVLNYNESYKHRTYNIKRKREEGLVNPNPDPEYQQAEAIKKRRRAHYDSNRDKILTNNTRYKRNKESSLTSPSLTQVSTTVQPTTVANNTPSTQPTETTTKQYNFNKRKVHEISSTTATITDFFKKKQKHNEDDKPP
jgi:hypothetical protein